MELIVTNPCPPIPQLPVLDPEQETRGRRAALETLIQVVRLEPQRLYVFSRVPWKPDAIIDRLVGRVMFTHAQRLRCRLGQKGIEPDAFLLLPGGKHRRLSAWWGATLQGTLEPRQFHRGVLAKRVLELFEVLEPEQHRRFRLLLSDQK